MNTTGNCGQFVLSLDTELAWGAVHRGGYAGRERDFDRTRYVVEELLGLLDKYEISATWAIVGHLFIETCWPVNGVKHPEIVRPDYPGFVGDWFDRDPCSNVYEDPYWYGTDIVRKIVDCATPQEIGSHNFSHVIVDQGCSRESFASELEASKAAAAEWDVSLESFVFPRNVINHLDVLAESGITAFRGITPNWTAGLPGWLQRPARFVDAFLPLGTPTARPNFQNGMWDIPASYNYLHRTGWGRLVPIKVRVRKAISGLRQAGSRGEVFHLWTHPFNIASDPIPLLRGLESIFHEVCDLRASGLIENVTMGELARQLNEQRESERAAVAVASEIR